MTGILNFGETCVCSGNTVQSEHSGREVGPVMHRWMEAWMSTAGIQVVRMSCGEEMMYIMKNRSSVHVVLRENLGGREEALRWKIWVVWHTYFVCAVHELINKRSELHVPMGFVSDECGLY